MKNYNFRISFQRILTLLILLFAGTALICQTPSDPFQIGTTSEQVFTWYTAIYGAVITAVTYVQGAFFKNSKWIPNTAVRYILIAVVAAALFLSLGWINAIQVFIGFIGAAITYDKILSPLGLKTPKKVAA